MRVAYCFGEEWSVSRKCDLFFHKWTQAQKHQHQPGSFAQGARTSSHRLCFFRFSVRGGIAGWLDQSLLVLSDSVYAFGGITICRFEGIFWPVLVAVGKMSCVSKSSWSFSQMIPFALTSMANRAATFDNFQLQLHPLIDLSSRTVPQTQSSEVLWVSDMWQRRCKSGEQASHWIHYMCCF